MTLIADRYELGDPLGEGGMARVVLARDRVLDRAVAIKLLRPEMAVDENLRERFVREAKLAARLNHPNIVAVYDAGIHEGMPWMAMERVDGPTLRDEMDGAPFLTASRTVEVGRQVLNALAAAHAAGVVHRDIKPGNVLMAADGAKLGDFGIAKMAGADADLTQINQFMGTPKYTAPEVATGDAATPRSDLYSTAVMLWEMLAGFPPYSHDNPLTLAMMHRTDPLPDLAQIRRDLSQPMIDAVAAGLAKDPASRIATAAQFADLLQRGLAGDPAVPTAPPDVTRPVPAMDVTRQIPRREPARDATRQAPVGPPPAGGRPAQPGARPGQRTTLPPRRSGTRWSLWLALILFIGLAVAAFTLTQSDDGATPEVSPTPTATATATPTPTPTAAATTPPVITPTAAPPPAPTAQPTTAAPTVPPTPVAPTTDPVPTAQPAPTEPQPAPEPTPLLDIIDPGPDDDAQTAAAEG